MNSGITDRLFDQLGNDTYNCLKNDVLDAKATNKAIANRYGIKIADVKDLRSSLTYNGLYAHLKNLKEKTAADEKEKKEKIEAAKESFKKGAIKGGSVTGKRNLSKGPKLTSVERDELREEITDQLKAGTWNPEALYKKYGLAIGTIRNYATHISKEKHLTLPGSREKEPESKDEKPTQVSINPTLVKPTFTSQITSEESNHKIGAYRMPKVYDEKLNKDINYLISNCEGTIPHAFKLELAERYHISFQYVQSRIDGLIYLTDCQNKSGKMITDYIVNAYQYNRSKKLNVSDMAIMFSKDLTYIYDLKRNSAIPEDFFTVENTIPEKDIVNMAKKESAYNTLLATIAFEKAKANTDTEKQQETPKKDEVMPKVIKDIISKDDAQYENIFGNRCIKYVTESNTLSVGLCEGRHDLPVSKFIFGSKDITSKNMFDYDRLNLLCDKFIKDNIKKVGPNEINDKKLLVYTTGLAQAQAAIIAACYANHVNLSFMNFDAVHDKYIEQPIVTQYPVANTNMNFSKIANWYITGGKRVYMYNCTQNEITDKHMYVFTININKPVETTKKSSSITKSKAVAGRMGDVVDKVNILVNKYEDIWPLYSNLVLYFQNDTNMVTIRVKDVSLINGDSIEELPDLAIYFNFHTNDFNPVIKIN